MVYYFKGGVGGVRKVGVMKPPYGLHQMQIQPSRHLRCVVGAFLLAGAGATRWNGAEVVKNPGAERWSGKLT